MAVTISGSGQIINKISQAVKTDTFTCTSKTFIDVTGLSVTLTPTSASSRFLIIFDIASGADDGVGGVASRMDRNGTAIYIGDTAGTRPRASGFMYPGDTAGGASAAGNTKVFLDSPATTSAVTYKVQIRTSSTASGAVYINRTDVDRDVSGDYDARMASSITVMEVSG
jgi:hypothetical protein